MSVRFHRNAMVAATDDLLASLPPPASLGPKHRPAPHLVIVEEVRKAVQRHPELSQMIGHDGLAEAWELSEDFSKLNGTVEFIDPVKAQDQKDWLRNHRGEYEYTGIDPEAVQRVLPPELRGSHGIVVSCAHSNDKRMSLRIDIALRILLCSNLAVGASQAVEIRRKHTGDDPWGPRIEELLEAAFQQFEQFQQQIMVMRNASITDSQAKELIYDVFTLGSSDRNELGMPYAKLREVGNTYFGADSPDVRDRTRWGLHNAFTRHLRDLPIRRQQQVGQRVTQVLVRDLLDIPYPN